jgi:hypothetical protein
VAALEATALVAVFLTVVAAFLIGAAAFLTGATAFLTGLTWMKEIKPSFKSFFLYSMISLIESNLF